MASNLKNGGAVAPKERINISYRPATGNSKEGVELPFKILVLGDFTKKESSLPVEERQMTSVNSNNFNNIVSDFDLTASFSVENKFTEDGEHLDIDLSFQSMSDFEPDNILEQVPELREVLKLRDALKALKGPLGNSPQMRKKIQAMLSDESTRKQLMKEIDYKTRTASEELED